MIGLDFYKGKKVFVTGHTGFKGSWLCRLLVDAGAEVTGYSLEPPTDPSLFSLCRLERELHSVIGDIRDSEKLSKTLQEAQPQIVLHLAAQPLVRYSYEYPAETYETNVMGTVNILESIRRCDCVRSFVNVTTDKVYQNQEWEWGYRETDTLNGYDPYSNSKSCSELVTDSYRKSFFGEGKAAISTVRAGNVIGGGDFAVDRLLPDCIRAAAKKESIVVRNPHAVRPFQHVLDPLAAYLMIAGKQYEDPHYAGSYNVGPDERDCISAGQLAELFCQAWGEGQTWIDRSDGGPHEAGLLKLDCSRLAAVFGWRPRWHVAQAVEKTVDWARVYLSDGDVSACMRAQIKAFMKEEKERCLNI